MTLPTILIARQNTVHYPEWKEGEPINHGIELISIAGSGGISKVWKIRDLSNKETYALKVFRGNMSDPDHRRMADNEANTPLSNDPRFVTAIDSCHIAENRKALLMPWIDGVSLSDLIGSTTINPKNSLKLMQEIADTVSYMHNDLNRLHNDLKPSNIMLSGTNNENVHIIDFDLHCEKSAQQNAYGGLTSFGGTWEYAAPEIIPQSQDGKDIGGLQNASERSDVWSLGCVLLYIVTKKTLWDYLDVDPRGGELQFLEICNKNLEGPISDFNNLQCEPWVSEVIKKCLNPTRSERPLSLHVKNNLLSDSTGSQLSWPGRSRPLITNSPPVKTRTGRIWQQTKKVDNRMFPHYIDDPPPEANSDFENHRIELHPHQNELTQHRGLRDGDTVDFGRKHIDPGNNNIRTKCFQINRINSEINLVSLVPMSLNGNALTKGDSMVLSTEQNGILGDYEFTIIVRFPRGI